MVKAKMSDGLLFKLTLVLLGTLTTFALWVAQCWISTSAIDTRAQAQEIRELDVRATKMETILPEIRNSLEEIKKDIKFLSVKR